MISNSSPTYLIPGQVWKVVQSWASSQKNVDKVTGVDPNNPDISPNTRIIVPHDNVSYDMRYNMYESLFKSLVRHYPKSYISPIRERSSGSSFHVLSINTNKDISIKIYVGEKNFKPRALRPGLAFEDYVSSIVKEGIKKIEEVKKEQGVSLIPNSYFDLTLHLRQKSRNRTIKIPGITSVVELGKNNDKADIKIYSGSSSGRPATATQISLKQNNFAHWSSANTYTKALSLFEKNVSRKIVDIDISTDRTVTFRRGVHGIYFPATSEEVLKYCFGEGVYKVDYIVIGAVYQGILENFDIHVDCARIYKNKDIGDRKRLAREVYLLISSDLTSNASAFKDTSFGKGPKYKGLSVSFVNIAKLQQSKKYVRGIR